MQQYNAQLIEELSADFPRRKDVALDLGLMDGLYMNLPGIRAYWNFARMTYQPTLIDSVNGMNCTRTLTNTTQIPDPHIVAGTFQGNSLWYRNNEAALYVSGIESLLDAPNRGMYVGCWVYPTKINSTRCWVAKRAAADNFQFQLKQVNASVDFSVSVDGINWVTVSHANPLIQNKWQFVLGRFDPSTSLDVCLDGIWSTFAAGIPASIFNGAAPLAIGGYRTLVPGNAEFHSGRLAQVFYGAADLPDRYAFNLYQWTRPLFGV